MRESVIGGRIENGSAAPPARGRSEIVTIAMGRTAERERWGRRRKHMVGFPLRGRKQGATAGSSGA
jgi:hypothetical protein